MKNCTTAPLWREKLFRIMKLTSFLLFCVIMQVAASSYSQKARLQINMKNAEVKDVLEEIKKQSEFDFLYKSDLIKSLPRVTVEVREVQVTEILDQIIPDDLEYEIFDRNIIIRKNPHPVVKPVEIEEDDVDISGKITDENGEGLPGASVIEKGTSNGTTTDLDGNYKLGLDEEATLVVSFVGYKTTEVAIAGRSTIDIQMELDAEQLEEIVVVGYGTVKKSDMTGSVGSVKKERLLDRPSVNVGQALTGKIAGVEVFNNSGRPDGKIKIRIRGNNSITASNDPLYVVDGIIGVSDINLISPNNIESLEVLKDASATAIYGARGANGVILITTKRGTETGKGSISYNGFVSMGIVAENQNLEFLNAEEWWSVYNTGFDNIPKYDPVGFSQGKYNRASPDALSLLFGADGKPLYDTDWEKEAYRNTVSHNHQLSFRNGDKNTSYSLFLDYMKQEALMDKNYLERYSGQVNVDSKLNPWLKVGMNVVLNYNTGNDLYNLYGIKRLAQEAIPLIPVKYPDGSWGSNRDFPGAVQDTPARYFEDLVNHSTTRQAISNFYLDFEITDQLSFKSTFATDSRNRKTNNYVSRDLIQFGGRNAGGIARISTRNDFYWQNENYFNFNADLEQNSSLNFMLGFSWQERTAELLGTESRNFVDDFYQWHNLQNGTVNMPSSSSDTKSSLNSYFARFNYNHSNKYLFTLTGRYDGSSKFGKNNKYAFFPSLAFAWNASNENFLMGNDVFDNVKFRLSLGQTGNQEIGDYLYAQYLGSSNVIFDNEFSSTLYRNSFGNPDLKWETTTQVDMGLDLSLINGRVDMTLDLYYKVTDDLLLNAPIPYSSGLNSLTKNIGSVENKGLEAMISTYNINTSTFSWQSTFNFATNKNKILKLGDNNEDIFPTKHATGQMQILRVDQPIGAFWGLTRLGTWNTDEAAEAAEFGRLPGDLKYEDLNGDNIINQDDFGIIGNSMPDWTLTVFNSFKYKNFDMSFDLRFVQGIDVMNAGTHNREDRSGVANSSKTILNAWTPENQNTMIAQIRYMRTYYDSQPDTHWLQDGSFVRLQNVMLGYSLPEPILSKLGISQSRIYVSGQNLLLLTGYKGYDPEVSTFEGPFGQGVDDFGEPRAKTYTIGLNINF